VAVRWINALRRNHALEHATAAILAPKLKPGGRLLGRAVSGGFYVYADVPAETVSQAAHEALSRLKSGEHGLAVSPFCGTNLVTAAVLAGMAYTILTGGNRRRISLPTTALASLAAILAAQPLGRLAQRYLTTSTDVSRTEIEGISSTRRGRYTSHRITTLQDQPPSRGNKTLQST
jgi:hypothetical protein